MWLRRSRPFNRRVAPPPPFPWRVVAEIALVGGAVGLMGLGVRTLLNPLTLPVTTVRVVGELHHVRAEELESLVNPVATGGFFTVDVHAVRQAARRLAWVDDVEVRREWPDTVRIAVTEQVPVARWQAGGLVNQRGEVFAPDPKSFPGGLVELGGPPGSAKLLKARVADVRAALAPVGLGVAALHMDARRAWSVVLSNGIELVLGRNDVAARLKRFLQVYPSALAPQAGRIKRVDLRYTNGFAVGWKQEA